jgi:multiple sugar transport system ATP-binding protein
VEPAVIEDLGSSTLAIFPIEAPPVDADAVRAASDDNDRAVLLASDRRALFTAELPESTDARAGAGLTLAVDASRFHFFDPETGEALRESRVAAAAF